MYLANDVIQNSRKKGKYNKKIIIDEIFKSNSKSYFVVQHGKRTRVSKGIYPFFKKCF
jgi:hypothetical protein